MSSSRTYRELSIRFAGAGGHGIVFAGRWLGMALVIRGYEVSLRPYYSPAQRGGWSKCDMVLAVGEEVPPILDEVDVLVVTLQSLYLDEIGHVRRGGLVIVDADAVKQRGARSDVIELAYPAFKTSISVTGKDRYGNAALIGFISGLLDLVDVDTLLTALKRLGGRDLEANSAVLRKGYEDGVKVREQKHIILS
ncbi:MAG: hypothetical protein GXO32_08725 [Crenarchaeota archaeon]|nr:hypothetical protein [Thermoproteota archaeon]